MKKILIASIVIIAIALALPIVGNKSVQNVLDTEINNLKTHGISIKESTDNSSYFTTKKHYEFLLEDTQKFLEYLNQFSTQQIPPYVKSVLDGVVVGADVEYSNIPYFSTVKVDIYPVSFSDKLDGLKEADKALYNDLQKFIADKALTYHIEHHIASKKFDGYVKNIDKTFQTNDGIALHVTLDNIKFHGQGKLIAPDKSEVNIDKIALKMNKSKENILIALSGWHSTSNFASVGTYATTMGLNNVKFISKGSYNNDFMLNIDAIQTEFSSDTAQEKAQLFTKTTMKKFDFTAQNESASLEDFSYDIALTKLDNTLYLKLIDLANKVNANPTLQTQQALQQTIVALFSKGMHLKVGNFSFANLKVAKQTYGSMKLNADATLQEDAQLFQKLQAHPNAAVQDLNVTAHLELSKSMLDNIPNMSPLRSLAKMQNDTASFDIIFDNARLSVNGKPVR